MKKEFKVGQVWITRDGLTAEITSISDGADYPIAAMIANDRNDVRTFTLDGLNWSDETHDVDLMSLQEFDAPVDIKVDNSEHKKQLWISVYTAKISTGSATRDAYGYAKQSVEDFEKYFEQK